MQDEWKPRSNLTLNLGARYDLQTKIFNEDFTQARYPTPAAVCGLRLARRQEQHRAPAGIRVGCAQRGRSVLRGGYGIVVHQPAELAARRRDHGVSAVQRHDSNPSYPDPYQGRDPLSFVSTAPPNITIGANDLRNPFAQTASADSLNRSDRAWRFTSTASTRGSTITVIAVNINTPDPVTGLRPLPQWGQIVQLQPSQGSFDYRALLVRLEKRYSTRYLYTVSYTLRTKKRLDREGRHTPPGASPTSSTRSRSRTGRYRSPPQRRGQRICAAAVLAAARSRLDAPLVAALQRAGRQGSQRRRLHHRLRAGDDEEPGGRNLDLSLGQRVARKNGPPPISASQIDGTRYNRLDARVSKAIHSAAAASSS